MEPKPRYDPEETDKTIRHRLGPDHYAEARQLLAEGRPEDAKHFMDQADHNANHGVYLYRNGIESSGHLRRRFGDILDRHPGLFESAVHHGKIVTEPLAKGGPLKPSAEETSAAFAVLDRAFSR